MQAGGADPLGVRFRVVEYERVTGRLIGVLLENSGFLEALANTSDLVARGTASHFCLEPVGFVQ